MNNRKEIVQSLSDVTKTYLRISKIKTALTVFIIGYTVIKAVILLKAEV